MAANENRLVWLDMEMTGLDPSKERIIEVAVVVTEPDLTIVAEGPVLVVHQPDSLLDAMDSWNKSTHGKSGLIDKVKASTLSEAQAEQMLLDFLSQHVPAGKSPLCGNTISQDRRFMYAYMPNLERFFHYRNLDVSTLKELARRWVPAVYKGFEKKSKHEALADIYESIDELKYYREHFLKV
ncbi:oligoribonuclease [Bordetella genomosp. 4]|uniref:Oligoribonuclease n=1 Tax=Bordetella genomosp. 4 TaxID=463044 RepID=A0A261U6B9_9BORD|nr:oligoribonuclease [Bordetella genomosp. 4]OZI51284.1 oligoribonuclease [Bordetella genomosp. 4]OZI57474.1 oligoribonuclease [Bordetella genomosp. 4]